MMTVKVLSEGEALVVARQRRRRATAILVLALVLLAPGLLGLDRLTGNRLNLFRAAPVPTATEARGGERAARVRSARTARSRAMALTTRERPAAAGPLVARGLGPAEAGEGAVKEEAASTPAEAEVAPPAEKTAPDGLTFLDLDRLQGPGLGGLVGGGTPVTRPPAPPSVETPLVDPPLGPPTTEPGPGPETPLIPNPPPGTTGPVGPLTPVVRPTPDPGGPVTPEGPPRDPPPPTTGVPEPQTWALLLLGFGALGAMLRRRRALA
jgi:hypothetical protein